MSLADGALASDLEFDAEEIDAYELGWNSTLVGGSMTFNGAVFYQEVDNFQQLNFVGTNFEVASSDFEIRGIELDLVARPLENLIVQASYAYTDAEDVNTGLEPIAQPDSVFNVATTLFLPIAKSIIGTFHLNARYNGEQRLEADDRQGSFTLLNGRISFAPREGNWEFSIFGENLTDRITGTASFDLPLQVGSRGVFPTTPRMYGAEVRYDF